MSVIILREVLLILQFILYVLAFVWLWLGAGFIVTAASKFSKKLRLSPFAFSFVFLGLLTSTPEFSVGLQAVADHDAEIFVGNLLGGIVVMFLVIIPALAIFGKKINLRHELDKSTMLLAMGVIATPSLLVLDKRVTNLEGIVMIVLFFLLLYFVERKKGIFDKSNSELLNAKAYSYNDIFNILLGLVIVFVASSIIVEKTMYFADIFSVSAFYISLIVISLGTNLPELSLAVRSVLSGKNEVAMGDYIGSAAANTFLFGLFTLMHNGEILTVSNFFITFFFIISSVICFYVLFLTQNGISRKSGIAFLCFYILFVILELA